MAHDRVTPDALIVLDGLPELPDELLVFYAHVLSGHDLRLWYSRRQIRRCVRRLCGYGVDLRALGGRLF